jgi:hypothetical protein
MNGCEKYNVFCLSKQTTQLVSNNRVGNENKETVSMQIRQDVIVG